MQKTRKALRTVFEETELPTNQPTNQPTHQLLPTTPILQDLGDADPKTKDEVFLKDKVEDGNS